MNLILYDVRMNRMNFTDKLLMMQCTEIQILTTDINE